MAFNKLVAGTNAHPGAAMRRMILTPSTNPAAVQQPDPLLLFIQQAQLALVYASPR